MHKIRRDKILNTRASDSAPLDHNVHELMRFSKRVYLTQKLLGNAGDSGCAFGPNNYCYDLLDPKNLQYQLESAHIQDFQDMAMHFKGFLPRINKAMARRMIIAYQAFRRQVDVDKNRRDASDHPYQWRLEDGFQDYFKKDRLIPLSFEQYKAFADHVYVKRGSPKYYKKEITGARFGHPRTYKEKRTGNYNIERYVGVQCYRDKDTGRVGVRMGIVNEKRHNVRADRFYK